jgi:hypothetical protein
MSDLNPDARRLVDLARRHRTPGEDAKLRIAERLAVPLAASLAAGAAASAAKAAAAAEMAAGAKAGATLFGSLGFKIAAVLVLSAAVTTLAVSQLSSGPSTAMSPRPAPAARAPEPARFFPAAPSADATEADGSRDLAPPILPSALPPAKSPSVAPTRAAEPAHELAQEAALLHEAQAAWRAGQSAQALSLANQHAQRFPHSQLGNERDVLRVLSLCKLGQTQAARQVGAHLLKSAKGSPWYQSVADSCAAR